MAQIVSFESVCNAEMRSRCVAPALRLENKYSGRSACSALNLVPTAVVTWSGVMLLKPKAVYVQQNNTIKPWER